MASVFRGSAASRSMSRSESTVTLPEIPQLPPLEPIGVPRQDTNESFVTTSSVTSHDSYTTVLTSSTTLNNSLNTAKASPNPNPSHSLRKSISVDSFIKNRLSAELSASGPSSSVHSGVETSEPGSGLHDRGAEDRTNTNFTVVERSLPAPGKSLASRILGRSRGHSLSAAPAAEYDDPYLDDSEHERTSDMAHLPLLPSRTRSVSSPHVNGHGRAKKPRQGDALLLPSRTQTLFNANGIGNGGKLAQLSDSAPPVPPVASARHRRQIPGPLVMPSRTPSESLRARRESLSNTGSDISIAVVGPSGCGKSMVIRKGLKNWGLSDETVCNVTTARVRLRYTSRTVSIPPGHQSARLAHVYELDSDVLQLDTPEGAWPEGLPHIDGVFVCYNASDMASFSRVQELLSSYHALHLSAIAVACKCDLEKKVPPHWASDRAAQYHVGLVEVDFASEDGKRKMRHCFSWMLRAIAQTKRGEGRPGSPYRNPASPDILTAPWSDGYSEARAGSIRSHSSTHSVGSPAGSRPRENPAMISPTAGTSTPTQRSPSAPASPVRVKSTGDLVSDVERSKKENLESHGDAAVPLGRAASASVSASTGSLYRSRKEYGSQQDEERHSDKEDDLEREETESGVRKDSSYTKENEPPSMPWATFDELLDKLFFLAVSGDDSAFLDHFFLTYRRFATPRSVLLAMQKRMRQLNMSHTDMLLGSYAQMRICDLLEGWIENYPGDFTTPGADAALRALIKQLLSNPSTIHYGSDILPFLEELSQLRDMDASWSIKIDGPHNQSDDEGIGLFDDDDDTSRKSSIPGLLPSISEKPPNDSKSKTRVVTGRERKGSFGTKSLLTNPLTTTISGSSDNSGSVRSVAVSKASLKELLKVSNTLAQYSATEVAEEITRQQSELFMSIEPRQWLRYTMGNCRSESESSEPISGSAVFYNRLSTWVTSLILAHQRLKERSRQVERFSELAEALRLLNNYAGLRAVMTGINNATYPNDEVMMNFMQTKRIEYKQYRSYEVLLNSSRNHRAYRMALKHTTGPAIPDMEVHTFDMVRAHESNDDHRAGDPKKIHWGKFTLMARMIATLHGFQKKISSTGKFDYPEHPNIKRLIFDVDLMDEAMQTSRVWAPPDDSFEVPYPTKLGVESPNLPKSDTARFRRLFFW